jgi:tetratricopeptide (TPR) repeat protein
MNLRSPLLFISLLAVACAGAKNSPNPAVNAPSAAGAWTELRSAHFILDTDASDETAASLMAKLERFRAGDLQALTGGDAELPGHIRVIVPASRGMFLDVAGDWNTAFYAQGPYSEPVILAPVASFLDEPELVAHELAHAVSSYLFPEQPRWFSEGIALFVQTLGSRVGDSAMVGHNLHVMHASAPGTAVGAVPSGYGDFSSDSGLAVRSAALLNWKGKEDPATHIRYHVSSWLLYHWLWNTRGRELSAFEKQLADGDDPRAAWLTNFPDLDPAKPAQMEKLDVELVNYRKRGRFVMAKIEAKAEFKTSDVAISAADVRLWLIHLRLEWPKNKDDRAALMRAQLEKARAEDPKNPAALLRLAALDGKVTPETARAAAEGAPQDFRGWMGLSTISTDPKEKEMAARKAVALETECASCNNQLAWILAESGRAKEALPYANRAVDLAPWDARSVDSLAEVAVQLWQCPEAIKLETRAVRMAVGDGQQKDAMDARLKRMKERCGGK